MPNTSRGLIYLASPYTGTDAERYQRFHDISVIAGHIHMAGFPVFSPIAHSHPIYERNPETGHKFEQWVLVNHLMIDLADEVWVATDVDGWDRSRGVHDEIEYAHATGKPVRYIIDAKEGIVVLEDPEEVPSGKAV